ncbi:hypothetical protein ACH5RR_023303, partial [Cinchona calisaya]
MEGRRKAVVTKSRKEVKQFLGAIDTPKPSMSSIGQSKAKRSPSSPIKNEETSYNSSVQPKNLASKGEGTSGLSHVDKLLVPTAASFQVLINRDDQVVANAAMETVDADQMVKAQTLTNIDNANPRGHDAIFLKQSTRMLMHSSDDGMSTKSPVEVASVLGTNADICGPNVSLPINGQSTGSDSGVIVTNQLAESIPVRVIQNAIVSECQPNL